MLCTERTVSPTTDKHPGNGFNNSCSEVLHSYEYYWHNVFLTQPVDTTMNWFLRTIIMTQDQGYNSVIIVRIKRKSLSRT